MAILQVTKVDGVFGIKTSETGFIPIRLGEKPVNEFLPGWEPVHVLDCLKPTFLLRLRHEAGHDATWILDDGMRHGGSALSHVPSRHGHLARTSLALFKTQTENILTAPVVGDSGGASDIPLLSIALVDEMLNLAWPEMAERWSQVSVPELGPDGAGLGFGVPFINQTFAGSMIDGYRNKIRTGDFQCVSPFSGHAVSAEIGLLLGNRLTAYRFADPVANRVFFLITKDYHDTKAAIVVPDRGLYCPGPEAPNLRSTILALVGHVGVHEAALRRCLFGPSRSKAVVNFLSEYPSNHLGHVIWNELGGLADLVDRFSTAKLPWVCVMNAQRGSEPFGKVDELFPELQGRVMRPDFLWAGAAAEVYARDLFFIRYMTKFVTADLGRRIRRGMEVDAAIENERALSSTLSKSGQLRVLIGLRPGNRTVGNFFAFIQVVIDHLMTRSRTVLIVLEGHNARLGGDATTSWGSSGPAGGTEPLLEELSLVLATRRHYRDDARVEIISTVGSPMSTAIFWTSQADFFVAPWGAALAKYRWVCNRPGFVVTNRFNLVNKPADLAIYHDPNFVEAPSPMYFIDEQDVENAPGHEGFYANFEPDPAAVRAGLDRLIAETRSRA